MGAALLSMVVELTTRGETADPDLTEVAMGAAAWRSELLNLAELDATAYEGVITARRMGKESEREREARDVQVAVALREATRAPLETVRAASAVIDLAARLAPVGTRHAISDVGVAVALAQAAARGAELNVLINLPYVRDEDLRREATSTLDELMPGLGERSAAVLATVRERLA